MSHLKISQWISVFSWSLQLCLSKNIDQLHFIIIFFTINIIIINIIIIIIIIIIINIISIIINW